MSDDAAAEALTTQRRLLEAYIECGEAALQSLHGDFAVALIDPRRNHALLAVDRMSVHNLIYAELHDGFAFAPSSDALARIPGAAPQLDPQQVFNYLYFHMVPGPATIYRGWRRVPPGHLVAYSKGRVEVRPHWRPVFTVGTGADFHSRKRDFRAALEDGVFRGAADLPLRAR